MIVNLVRYITSCIAIPVIHKLCSVMASRGRPLTLLNRLVAGHIFMVIALTINTIIQHHTPGKFVAFVVISQMLSTPLLDLLVLSKYLCSWLYMALNSRTYISGKLNMCVHACICISSILCRCYHRNKDITDYISWHM